jgi:hypothetical protein
VIQDAESEIAHDVVTEYAARLRGAGHDQVGIAFAHFSENLVNHDSVANMHFRRHAKFFEILFLAAEIDSKF